MTVIIAGHFEQQDEAKAALAALHRAGAPDGQITSFYVNPPGRRLLLTAVISVNRPVIRDSAARMYSLQAGFSLFEQVAHCEASFNLSGEKSCHSHFGH